MRIATETATALVERLRTVGSDLPSALAARIVAFGSAVVPLLLCLIDDRPLTENDGASNLAPACSDCGQQHDREWPPLHAVDLLTELREPRAIETMLTVLQATSSDEPLHDKIVERLPDFGVAALEPTLATLARTTKDAEVFESLCCILSVLGVRDGRILEALLELLTVHPRAAAMYLGDYGDPAACPALLAAITASEPDVADSSARMERLDLVDVYASLGGELPVDVKERISAWLSG